MEEFTSMFKPTINNLYHLMKDMTVKPSMYEKRIYTERAFSMGFCYRTILNMHKDFVITHAHSNNFRVVLTEYKYSVWIPFEVKSKVYTVEKYA